VLIGVVDGYAMSGRGRTTCRRVAVLAARRGPWGGQPGDGAV